MTVFYEFLPKDGTLQPCVFKDTVGEALLTKQRYRKFACSLCGRIDVGRALAEIGLDASYNGSAGKRHLIETYDYMFIVNADLRKIFETLCDDILYFDIQSKGTNFVIWPRSIVLPDESGRYSRSGRCSLCDICRSTVFGPDAFTEIPDISIVAVLLEGPQGPMPAWFVTADVAKKIKEEKCKGISLVKWISV